MICINPKAGNHSSISPAPKTKLTFINNFTLNIINSVSLIFINITYHCHHYQHHQHYYYYFSLSICV